MTSVNTFSIAKKDIRSYIYFIYNKKKYIKKNYFEKKNLYWITINSFNNFYINNCK